VKDLGDAVGETFGTVYSVAGDMVHTVSATITTEINSANTLIDDITGINVEHDLVQVGDSVASFVEHHASLFETIGEDALMAGLVAVGVPAPLAMALGSLAANIVANGGHLTATGIGEALGEAAGDALGGPLVGTLGSDIAQTVSTGKLDLAAVAGSAVAALAPGAADALGANVAEALDSVLGQTVGGATGSELSSIAVGALSQLASTGSIDFSTLATSALTAQTQIVTSMGGSLADTAIS
jgi:hypothetical protein